MLFFNYYFMIINKIKLVVQKFPFERKELVNFPLLFPFACQSDPVEVNM
jgi:hypothetical protein